jgi:hypothetical protein
MLLSHQLQKTADLGQVLLCLGQLRLPMALHNLMVAPSQIGNQTPQVL